MADDSSDVRFGVEEEFLVVDPVTRAVVPLAAPVISRAVDELGARVGGEITKLQVEARTLPCHTTAALHTQLVQGRSALATAATAERLRIVATGSPVLGQVFPPPITTGPRQDQGTATFRGLHDDLGICAVHVHVELPDRDRAVLVSNHLRPHLPVLIALTANSPYWDGRDTGYASWRTVTWGQWPVAGPPPRMRDAAHYDQLVATLLDAGTLVDVGTLFWDIRLCAHQPTLEVRVADVPMTADESAAFAALVRALVIVADRAVDRGDPGPEISAELMRAAYWRAARDGFAGSGIDVTTGRLVPAATLADRLLRIARPALVELDDLVRVESWLRRLAVDADGASRQRRAATGPDGLAGIVDHLVEQTQRQQPMSTYA
ncbi:glutamate--cysteine ligase [Solwaraspora sp. WMMD406]|uniref:carboxylate-amine ligase n=1 Tax=Solwaraspora sp. WMMD406 TaxID=3016095 RepID=UPI0024171990|nr:glutamate--cysteine ligase [Solwaraspora sp. WMMD406]MDG4763497.1 glutamate--cysteine ligase [Solwaraspora sp. WMMD406]